MGNKRYQRNVNRVYEQLTDEQLAKQVAKFWYSDVSHKKGKLGRALKEIESRKNGE